jgi:FKBP-type peptidyl-prolyl cis-trans isomerase
VIPGWTEALQLMQEGAKWQIVIPPKLAYADQGPLAGQVLVFDVELLKVGPPEAGK